MSNQRITVVPADACVIVEGDALAGLALPVSTNVHAIQWHGTHGIIERRTGGAEYFTDFSVVAPFLSVWQAKRDELDTAPPPPPPAVASVTPWQIRKALNATGLRAAVEAAVAGADQTTRDAWEFAQEFRRDNPLIGAVAAQLGKTAQEVDDLFALARSL